MARPPRRWGFTLTLAVAWAVLLYLLLPLFIVVPVSLTPERFLIMPTDELSTHHYVNLVTNEKWTDAIGQSLIIAVAATAIAVVTGTLAAIGLWRLASRFAETLRAFVLLPIIVPPIVSGLAFYRVFVDLGMLDTLGGVILAHAVLAAPFVVITVSTSLAGFDLKLEQAARNLGASVGQAMRLVILPNIVPGVVSGTVFAFILSWDEIVVTLFVSKLNVFTLPRRMWDGIREQADPTIAACATALIVLTALGVLAHTWFVIRRTRYARATPA
jgi:putative spermidine/putrescine transport system permease protein